MPSRHRGSPTLTIRITPESLESAIKSKSGACLIVDNIKRQYPQYTRVEADMATIRLTDRDAGKSYVYLTPQPAQICLLSFDQGWRAMIPAEITLRRAVKTTNIIRPSARRVEERAKRYRELSDKQDAGIMLTAQERKSLGILKKTPERPTAYGPSQVHDVQGRPVVVGGPPLVKGRAHPNLLRGTDRHFGAKLADPGDVFREAVEAAVSERLMTMPATEATEATE